MRQTAINQTSVERLDGLPADTIQALAAERLLNEVPERLLWGSDWPHVFIRSAMPNDGDLFNLFADWLGDRALLHNILVDHPAQLYGF